MRNPEQPVVSKSLIGGIVAALGLAFAAGTRTTLPRAEAAPVATASLGLPPGSMSLDDRLKHIEESILALERKMQKCKPIGKED